MYQSDAVIAGEKVASEKGMEAEGAAYHYKSNV